MTPDVRDFPSLVQWIADTYHRGHLYPIAKKTGLSAALIDQWKHGVVRTPKIDSLMQLCESYDLDFARVVKLLAPKRRGSRVLLGLVLALALASGVRAEAGPLLVVSSPKELSVIGSWLRRLWVAWRSTGKLATV